MYDVVIIGGGIAGMTSAIYSTRRELKTLIITADVGGQMTKNPEIGNWPGKELVSGLDLSKDIRSQAEKLGCDFVYEKAVDIKKGQDKIFTTKTDKGSYRSKTVILAYGKKPRHLKVPGEKDLMGRGISYCVTCDGPFFRDKTVAVVGGGNSAFDAAILMSKIANKVYLVHRRDKFRAEEYLVHKLKQADNVEYLLNAEIEEIQGEKNVESIKMIDGKKVSVDAVFIEIGYEIDKSLIDGFVDIDSRGQVMVDIHQRTSVPGAFAAGDLTASPYQQLVVAAGQGASAALTAYDYIEKEF